VIGQHVLHRIAARIWIRNFCTQLVNRSVYARSIWAADNYSDVHAFYSRCDRRGGDRRGGDRRGAGRKQIDRRGKSLIGRCPQMLSSSGSQKCSACGSSTELQQS